MSGTLKEAIKNVDAAKADEAVRVTKAISIGEAVQQGDVYIHRVADDYKAGKLLGEGDVKVANGQTMGSRHTAVGAVKAYESTSVPDWFVVPKTVEWSQMVGPVIQADKKWTLKHPEHANHVLPAGRYLVTYQYDPRTMKRTVD